MKSLNLKQRAAALILFPLFLILFIIFGSLIFALILIILVILFLAFLIKGGKFHYRRF